MLDTITVRSNWPLRNRWPVRTLLPLSHGIKAKVGAAGDLLERVECSLPRVLFGHNGRLIESQDQMDCALEKLACVVGEIAIVPPVDEWRVSRVDLTWNFNLPAQALILAHSWTQFPRIWNKPNLFGCGKGLTWGAAKSKMMVKFYDKGRRTGGASILRVEILLRGPKLARHLPGNEWRLFDRAYQVYRQLLTQFPSIASPAIANNVLEALGFESFEIRQRVFAHLVHIPARTLRKWRQKTEAAALNFEKPFSWLEKLPPTGPPPGVSVPKRKGR